MKNGDHVTTAAGDALGGNSVGLINGQVATGVDDLHAAMADIDRLLANPAV